MKTIQVKLTVPQTVETVEFELPHYSRKGDAYWAVISPVECIRVHANSSDAPLVYLSRLEITINEAFGWENETISAEDFARVYQRSIETLNQKFTEL